VVTIVDYGMGNLGSVKNMFKKIGEEAIITADPRDVLNSNKILLPGVGSFDRAIANLIERGLFEVIKEKVTQQRIPILGICLGMQLLAKASEEGESEGFGFIDAYAKKFDFAGLDEHLPIPHMGWNKVMLQKKSPLFANMHPNPRFYFVHSYAIQCKDQFDSLTTTNYGYNFVSAFEHENILGVQFHPEKSHKFGMKLLQNFVENY
jgi:imidazole glycerol-phosphate synthase subunit HisH